MIFPKVLIVLAVKNEAGFLENVLNDLLCDTYPNKEILVFDDGSTDQTENIVSVFSHRVKLIIHKQSQGQAFCINKALELTDASYVAIADGDDRYYPEKISRQIAFMEGHPEIGICGCQIETIPSGLHWNLPRTHDQIMGRLPLNMPLAHPALVYRKSALAACRYDESMKQSHDYDFIVRIRHKTKFHNLPFRGMGYRLSKADEHALKLRVKLTDQIRSLVLAEDFGITDSEFVRMHNSICNLEHGVTPDFFPEWIKTIMARNRFYHHESLQKELHTQLWFYINKFKLSRVEGLKHLLLSGLPLFQKAKAGIRLLL